VWLDGVGQAGTYGTAERMNGRTRLHRCREGIPVDNGTRIEGVACKDQYEKTRHKMCRHQLNGWSWKDDEMVRWKYQPDIRYKHKCYRGNVKRSPSKASTCNDFSTLLLHIVEQLQVLLKCMLSAEVG